MLESLKDLYISYPFLPVPTAPEFFKQVKDIRLVLELPATDVLLGYKNNRNGNYVRAWLTGFARNGQTGARALLRIQCSQLSEDMIESFVELYSWEGILPSNQSYMLCDPALIDTLPVISEGIVYELNPEVLVLLQKAPKLYKDGSVQPLPEVIRVERGYNVSPTITNDTISFYGAVDVGSGTYPINQPFSLSTATQAQGARSINGLRGSVTVEPTFPVRIDSIENGILHVWKEDIE